MAPRAVWWCMSKTCLPSSLTGKNWSKDRRRRVPSAPMGSPPRLQKALPAAKGLSVTDLEVREIDGGEYAVATVQEKGRSSIEVLAEALPELIAGLKVDRTMRWNSSNVSFSRPIRWLTAVHGESLVPFAYAGYLRPGCHPWSALQRSGDGGDQGCQGIL